jgi:ATP-dependent phosphofructokinase / diphosphate-dependent phosphofructokinase
VGALAVRTAVKQGADGTIVIRRQPGRAYRVRFEHAPLKSVAKATRHMPDAFIGKDSNDVTEAFLAYARPIVGPLPRIGRFKGVKVASRA